MNLNRENSEGWGREPGGSTRGKRSKHQLIFRRTAVWVFPVTVMAGPSFSSFLLT